MKRYTKNKHPVVSIEATPIQKNDHKYFSNPGLIPSPEDLNEVVFQTDDDQMLTFEVSKFEYAVLEKGKTGTLVYQGYQLVSFD